MLATCTGGVLWHHTPLCQAMMTALGRLGVGFSHGNCGAVTVLGPRGGLTSPSSSEPLFMGNAGTAARFLTTVLCTLPDPYGALCPTAWLSDGASG